MVMGVDCLTGLLEKAGSTLITTHRHADIDAVASAELLRTLLLRKGIEKVDIYVPEGLSGITIGLLDNLDVGIEYVTDASLDYDLYIIVDTSNPKLLGALAEKIHEIRDRVVWIDHHLAMEKPPGRCFIYGVDASSTIEIVLDIVDQTLGIEEMDDNLLVMALAAIYVETRFLQLATPKTMYRVARLMELTGYTIKDVYAKLPREERDSSERMAIVKAMLRLEGWRADGAIILLTDVSSHHNKVSRQLLSIGGDVAIVYGYKKRGKIHIRAVDGKGELVKHLVEKLGEKLRERGIIASGGGHETIYNIEFGKMDRDELREIIIESLEETVKDLGYRIERLS